MFINFRSVFEFLFSSFDIAGDTKMIEKLAKEGVRFTLVIKRHWMYSIWRSWKVIFVIGIVIANVYLLTVSNTSHDMYSYTIAFFLLLNVVYWVGIVIRYIWKFYKLHGNEPLLEDVYSALRKSKKSDEIFTNFFNQTIFLLIVLFGITIFTTITGIVGLMQGGTSDFGVGMLNALLLIIQLMLFYNFMTDMINQEMDYKIVVPGQILYFDQKGMLGSSQNMNSNKIKTINTKYPGLIASFFNYGDIYVLTEGDQKDLGEMAMDYIGNPPNTVKEIEKVLRNDLSVMEKEVNLVLKRFKENIGYDCIETPEEKASLKSFIEENEDSLKNIFENGDDETKQEVKELFEIIHK